MKNTPQDKTLDEIFKVMQNELSDAWERYEGAQYDELDEYGEAYENAHAKAKQAINSYIYNSVLSLQPKKVHSPRIIRQKIAALPQNTSTTNANLTSVAIGYNFAIDDITAKAKQLYKGGADD